MSSLKSRTGIGFITLMTLLPGLPVALRAQQQDLEALRRQVEAQQKKVEEQAEALRRQQEELEQQVRQLETLATQLSALSGEARAEPAPAPPAHSAATREAQPATQRRDSVGDLNAKAIAAGDFPGSIRIPGSGRVSLGISGFLKSVAIGDSNLEGAGPIFLPANIGSSAPDQAGNASIDATLSRFSIDARAPTEHGGLRGYFEWDLNASNSGNPGFNLRHAYGSWKSRSGSLTFGHTWSTFMDLGVLPEGLTEPTISGAVFQRQAQIRWTQPVNDGFRFDVAIEDPSNRDVITSTPVSAPSRLPDFVGATQWDWAGRGHLRVGGILRRLSIEDRTANAWGIITGSHVNLLGTDKIALQAAYGRGVGRYLLGIPGSLGGFVDPESNALTLVKNWGGFATYHRVWATKLRSTAGFGLAGVDLVEIAPADAFQKSFFGLANLMFSPLPYLTYGVEYQYGQRRERSGFEQTNHRIIFALQVF